jgi:hypothetical protein
MARPPAVPTEEKALNVALLQLQWGGTTSTRVALYVNAPCSEREGGNGFVPSRDRHGQ